MYTFHIKVTTLNPDPNRISGLIGRLLHQINQHNGLEKKSLNSIYWCAAQHKNQHPRHILHDYTVYIPVFWIRCGFNVDPDMDPGPGI